MRTIVKGKNVEVPERVRDYTQRKMRRLERLLDDRTDAIVEFSNEMHKSASDAHIAEVTLVIDGRTLRSHAVGISYQAALDEVVDKVERQAVDHKSKPRLRARPEQEKRILQSLADGTREPGHERRIVKTKRFAIEPMFEEDAAATMDELGHRFFVFVNAETERIAILYARDDGDLGMIEPVIGGDYTTGRQHGNGRESGPLDERAPGRGTLSDRGPAQSGAAPAYDAPHAPRRPADRCAPAPRDGHGQGGRPCARDRRRRPADLHRQPDGLETTRRAAGESWPPSGNACASTTSGPCRSTRPTS